MLFGRVKQAVFLALSKYFFGKAGSALLRKSGPYDWRKSLQPEQQEEEEEEQDSVVVAFYFNFNVFLHLLLE